MDAQTSPPEPQNGGGPPPPGATPPKKRRGRPFGSRTTPPPLAENPVSAESGEPQPAEPRKRRRRAAQVDTDALRKKITGFHQLISSGIKHLTGDETLAQLTLISDTEAQTLAEGYAQVAREFDIELLGGRWGAVFQLVGAAALVYGPRVVMARKHVEDLQRRSGVVVDSTAEPVNGAASAAAAH
jgi:hypothetical protein